MKIGFVGLGRMGKNMVYNLLDKKQEVVAWNRSPDAIAEVVEKGAVGSENIKDMISKLPERKVVWLMVPSGKIVDDMIAQVLPELKKGDIIIDGGNSYFKDSQRRYKEIAPSGIHYLDCGTSGGMEGAREGACMMVGGDEEIFKEVEELFRDMCVKDGYGYMGKSGAGHFVKMVHNGIEYGMMGAIGEGLQAVEDHKKEFGTDLSEAIKVYSHGSIISSRLVSWLEKAWKEDHYLESISGEVPKGETEEEMRNLEGLADMKVLHEAIEMRVATRTKPTLAGKMVAAMRNQFGGHSTNKAKKE